MLACAQDPAVTGCSATGATNTCGGQKSAIAYFVSFMVLSAYTLLILLVAVIVEIFSTNTNSQDKVILAFMDFQKMWVERFGFGCSHADTEAFVSLVPTMSPLLTDFGTSVRRANLIRLLVTLHIPVDSKFRVSYRDVVYAFARRKYHVDFAASFLDYFKSAKLSAGIVGGLGLTNRFTVADIYAARIIQSAWKACKTRQQHANALDFGSSVRAAMRSMFEGHDHGGDSDWLGDMSFHIRGVAAGGLSAEMQQHTIILQKDEAATGTTAAGTTSGGCAVKIFTANEYIPRGAISIPGTLSSQHPRNQSL